MQFIVIQRLEFLAAITVPAIAGAALMAAAMRGTMRGKNPPVSSLVVMDL